MKETKEEAKVVIFDDDEGIILDIKKDLIEFDLSSIEFTKPSDCLEYLKKRKTPPLILFIDMKPCGNENIFSSNFNPELPIPEKIYEYVKSRGWEENFYFMSAHKSEHDLNVLNKTSAKFFLKFGELSIQDIIKKQGLKPK